MNMAHHIGVDENGLGARLGPLIVTAVLARVDERGGRALQRRLPKAIRKDLDDSKQLVSHGDVRVGEAWARALVGGAAETPDALLGGLLLEERSTLHAPCPKHVHAQCWSLDQESFHADDAMCRRVLGHHQALAERGIWLLGVQSSIVCTKRLNEAHARGVNRFIADLHAMESLVLSLRARAGALVTATCGKVGGMGSYGKFFGPLSHYLHTPLEEGKGLSAYHFPGVGQLRFVRDADALHPLVMLASLVGKYVRELLMARVVRFYPDAASDASPSGYHDPVTDAFVSRTALLRKERLVPITCFERARAANAAPLKPRTRATV